MDGEPDMNKLKADLGPDTEEVVAGSGCRASCTQKQRDAPYYTWLDISQADPKGTEIPYHLREQHIQVGEC